MTHTLASAHKYICVFFIWIDMHSEQRKSVTKRREKKITQKSQQHNNTKTNRGKEKKKGNNSTWNIEILLATTQHSGIWEQNFEPHEFMNTELSSVFNFFKQKIYFEPVSFNISILFNFLELQPIRKSFKNKSKKLIKN